MRKFYLYAAVVISLFCAGFALAATTDLFLFTGAASTDSPMPEAEAKNAVAINDDCPYTVTLDTGKNKTKPQTSCKNPNGQLTIIVSGGAYTSIDWYKTSGLFDPAAYVGAGTSISKLEAGSHTAVIRNSNTGSTCFYRFDVEDDTPNMDYETIIQKNVIGCDGQGGGELWLRMLDRDNVNNTHPFWYDEHGNKLKKDGNANTNAEGWWVFDNLPAGTYTIIVENKDTGCAGPPFTITIGQLTPPTIKGEVVDNTLCEGGNGSLNITITTEGTPPSNGFNLSWSGPVSGSASNVISTYDITNLPGGTYTVTASDPVDPNCTTVAEFTVADNLTYPSISQLEATPSTVCEPTATNGGYDGSITASVTYNGQAVTNFDPFTLSLFDEEGNTVASGNTNVFEGLEGGNYQVSVTHNATGCISGLASIHVPVEQPSFSLALTPTSQTNCEGSPNGSLAVEVSRDGTIVTSGFTLSWYQGQTTSGTQFSVSGNTASALAGDQYYTVELIDDETGCSAISTIMVPLTQIYPQITLTPGDNTGCVDGKYTGTITVGITEDGNAVSDFSDYTFTWLDAADNPLAANTSTAANVYEKLRGGNYQVKIKNKTSGCESDLQTVTIQDKPAAISLQLDPTAQTNCVPGAPDGPNGAIAATITGSTDYTLSWYEGETTSGTAIASSKITGNTATGLAGGKTYTVRLTDNQSGCTVVERVAVAVNQIAPQITLTPGDNTGCVDGKYTGTITVGITEDGNAVSDFSDYTFTWLDAADNPLAANTSTAANVYEKLRGGNYQVKIKNKTSGCESDLQTVTIQDKPAAISLQLDPTPEESCDAPDGTITPVITGSTDYTLSWYEGSSVSSGTLFSPTLTGNTATGLAGDKVYTVELVDNVSGCIKIASVSVSQNFVYPAITKTTVIDNPICDPSLASSGQYGGSIVADVAPAGNYTFEWFQFNGTTYELMSGESSATLSNIPDGKYQVKAINTDTQCESTKTPVSVGENKIYPQTKITTTPQTFCDLSQANGTATVQMLVGAATDYTYAWYAGKSASGTVLATTDQATQLLEGFYTIKVINKNSGCLSFATGYVNTEQTFSTADLTVNDIQSCDPADQGSIEASVNGSTADVGDYEFKWYQGQVVDESKRISETSGNILTEISSGVPLPSGYYTVVAQHATTACESEPVNGYLAPPPTLFAIDYKVNKVPAMCTYNEGVVTAWVDDGTTNVDDYTFTWYEGAPLNPSQNFYSDPAIQFNEDGPLAVGDIGTIDLSPQESGKDYFPARDIDEGPTLYERRSGVYTVVAERKADGCKEWARVEIPFDDAHETIQIDYTHADECNGTGEIAALVTKKDANDPSIIYAPDQGGYTFYLFEGSNPPAAFDPEFPEDDPSLYYAKKQGVAGSTTQKTVFGGLLPGDYILMALDESNDCMSAATALKVEQVALPPVVSISGKTPNTNCEGGNGAFTLNLGVGEYSPENFDYFTKGFEIQITKPDGTVQSEIVSNFDINAETSRPHTLAGLAEGDYSIRVWGLKSSNATDRTGCYTDINTTLGKNTPLPVIDASVTRQQTTCEPNGIITINEVTITENSVTTTYPLTDFDFVYFTSEADYQSGAAGIPVADSGPTPYTIRDLTAGSYYLVAKKKLNTTGNSEGCESSAVVLNISNNSVLPTISFIATTPNEECDDPSGTLTAEVMTGSNIGTYTFEWFVGESTDAADSFDGTVNNLGSDGNIQQITDLPEGTYTLQVTEGTCEPVVRSFKVESIKSKPVINTVATPKANTSCNTSYTGGYDIEEVKYKDLTFTGSDIDDNFTFVYYRSLNDFDNKANGKAAPASVANLEHGTYYVEARKYTKPGGYGCTSSPIIIEIPHEPIMPTLSFISKGDDACEDTEANGNTIASLTIDGNVPTAAEFTGAMIWHRIEADGSKTAVPAIASSTVNGEETADNLMQGNYEVTATLTNGCSVTRAFKVEEKVLPITLTVQATEQTSCNPGGMVEVTAITVDNQPAALTDFTYSWFMQEEDGALTPISIANADDNFLSINNYSSIEAGTYYVKAYKKDNSGIAAGCESSPFPGKINFNPVMPTLSLNSTPNQNCEAGEENGALTARPMVNGAELSGGFSIVWEVLDVNGNPSPLNTGTLSADEKTVSDLPAGTYRATVTLDNGCSVYADKSIGQPTPSFTTSLSVQPNTSCDVDNGGFSVEQIIYNDDSYTADLDTHFNFVYYRTQQDYEQQLNPVNAQATVNGLAPGTYYVVIEKISPPGIGCSSAPFVVTIPDQPFYPGLSLSGTDNNACNDEGANGEITATINAGNPAQNYTLDWYLVQENGDVDLPNTAVVDGLQVRNLPAGTYKAVVTLENGCPISATYRLSSQVTSFEMAFDTEPQVGCENGGEIRISSLMVNGSPAPLDDFTYNWYKKDANGNLTAIPVPANTTTLTVANYSDIEAGNYRVEAIKVANPAAGCGPVKEVTIPFTNTQPVITVNHLSPLSGCNPDSRGMIDISINSPVGNALTVRWFTSASFEENSLNRTALPQFNDQLRIDNLTGGYYYVEVTDPATGCSTNWDFLIEEEVIEAVMSASVQDRWKCFPENGEIYIFMVNKEAFFYAYPDSRFEVTITRTEDGLVFNEVIDISESHILHLLDMGVGTYHISYTETGQNKCPVPMDTVVIEDISVRYDPVIVQNDPYSVCNEAYANASLSAMVEGDTANYTFAWYEGDVDETTTSEPVNRNATATGLKAMTYTVIATSELTGCTTLAQYTIEEEPIAFTPDIEQDVMLTVCDPELANAELSASVNGTTQGYAFEWFVGEADLTTAAELAIAHEASAGGLGDTTYTVRVTDLNTGCMGLASHRIAVDFPVIPADSSWIISKPSTSCLYPNGSLEIGVDSLYSNYTIHWYKGPQAHPDSLIASGVFVIDSLAAGIYSATLTSQENSCTSASFTKTVDEEYYFPRYKVNITPSTCVEEGAAEVVSLDGSNFHYEWWYYEDRHVMIGQNSTYHGPAGKYWLKIVSDEGCVHWEVIEINEVVDPYNAISLNGDGINEYFHIGCIEMFPKNRVRIYNRAGTLVYETEGYDNRLNTFEGRGNKGVYPNGRDLPVGTYFYVVDKNHKNEKPQTGFLELIR